MNMVFDSKASMSSDYFFYFKRLHTLQLFLFLRSLRVFLLVQSVDFNVILV